MNFFKHSVIKLSPLSTRMASRSLMIAATLLLANCASAPKEDATPPQAQQVAPPALTPQQQAATRLQAEKDHFISDTQRRIGEMRDYENNLRTRAASETTEQSKKMQNAADDLGTLLKGVDSSLDDVKSASAENWVDYRRDVDRHMERASSMYSNSQSLFQ